MTLEQFKEINPNYDHNDLSSRVKLGVDLGTEFMIDVHRFDQRMTLSEREGVLSSAVVQMLASILRQEIVDQQIDFTKKEVVDEFMDNLKELVFERVECIELGRGKILEEETDEDMNNLNEIDHTEQTVTLGTEDNPVVTLMRGHVTPAEFVKANHKEGWGAPLDEMTEEDLAQEVEDESPAIQHSYGIFDPTAHDNHGAWKWNVDKSEQGAEPVTIREW